MFFRGLHRFFSNFSNCKGLWDGTFIRVPFVNCILLWQNTTHTVTKIISHNPLLLRVGKGYIDRKTVLFFWLFRIVAECQRLERFFFVWPLWPLLPVKPEVAPHLKVVRARNMLLSPNVNVWEGPSSWHTVWPLWPLLPVIPEVAPNLKVVRARNMIH